MNSRVIMAKKDPLDSAYRVHLEKQDAILDRLDYYMENSNWISRKYQTNPPKKAQACKNFTQVKIKCTKGVRLTIASTKNLHKDLKDTYGQKYLMTSRCDSDALESNFNVIKGMDGQNVDPSGLEIYQRYSRHCTAKILADKEFDIFSIKEELIDHLEKFCQQRSKADLDVESPAYDVTVPSELKDCELEGLHWIAGIGDCSKAF